MGHVKQDIKKSIENLNKKTDWVYTSYISILVSLGTLAGTYLITSMITKLNLFPQNYFKIILTAIFLIISTLTYRIYSGNKQLTKHIIAFSIFFLAVYLILY